MFLKLGKMIYQLFIIHTILFVSFIPKSFSKYKNEIYDIEEQRRIYNFSLIKDNPHLFQDYFLSLFKNSEKLNLSLFKINHKKLVSKINSIISNKEQYNDLYIILSSIYGAFLADAMGANTEFSPKNKNNHNNIYSEDGMWQPGQITDDSEMAMSQSFGILDNYNYKTINQNTLYYFYVLWKDSPPLDIGTTTRRALSFLNIDKVNITNENIFSQKIKANVEIYTSKSLSNGFIMRASPFITWFYMLNRNYVKEMLQTKSSKNYFELYQKIYEEFSKDTALTHGNKENAYGGTLLVFMGLCSLEQRYSGNDIINMVKILHSNNYFNDENNYIEYKLKRHFESILSEISKPDFNKDEFFGNLYYQMGFYKHAFNLTVYYLSIFDRETKINKKSLKDFYRDMIFDISDFGGDTDTNGAIVGSVLGPLIGLENLDRKYFDIFLNFYSRERIIYNSAFMYYYAEYLTRIENGELKLNKNENNVRFFVIDKILKLLNTEIDDI